MVYSFFRLFCRQTSSAAAPSGRHLQVLHRSSSSQRTPQTILVSKHKYRPQQRRVVGRRSVPAVVMPEEKKYAHTNGFAAANGHRPTRGLSSEVADGDMFLFTSESVGEGHPGTHLLSPKPYTLASFRSADDRTSAADDDVVRTRVFFFHSFNLCVHKCPSSDRAF